MIDETILNEILPIPKLEESKEELIKELEDEGFIITNFNPGGIFYTLIMIVLQVRIELIKLLREVLNHMFIKHATGAWLELKAAEFSKMKKQPVKTRGYVTLSREMKGEAVRIPKATVFKTEKDINGDELRYFVLEDTVIIQDSVAVNVLVEAEKAGSNYNVPAGQIRRCLVHLEGIDHIENGEGWITREGSDREDEESLRSRTLNSWAELSSRPIALKYKNVCEAVDGVLYVQVDDLHPRGQGTIDIIVTSTAGEATKALLSAVTEAAESIRGEYDNILVKSSVTVMQDITLAIILPEFISTDGIQERATAILIDYFKISKNRTLNELIQLDLLYRLKSGIPEIKNVRITEPSGDVMLDNGKVILLGNINVTITKE